MITDTGRLTLPRECLVAVVKSGCTLFVMISKRVRLIVERHGSREVYVCMRVLMLLAKEQSRPVVRLWGSSDARTCRLPCEWKILYDDQEVVGLVWDASV